MENTIELQIAKQSLSEIGWSDETIELKIADWIDRAKRVVNLPPDPSDLAAAMQKTFEAEFCAMVGSVAA
jgi:hypothetical protein